MSSDTTTLKKMLNLDNVVIQDYEIQQRSRHKFGNVYNQEILNVNIRPDHWHHCLCPICQNKCSIYDHQLPTASTWRASNLGGIPVFLHYRPARIICPEHGVLTEFIPWADGNSRFTPEFNNTVAWLVTRLPKTAIATYLDIDWRTVGNCVDLAWHRIEPDRTQRYIGVRKICIDEVSYQRGHKYITVVYDMERNNVLWAGKGHEIETIKIFCEELSQEQQDAIEIIAGDGAHWIDWAHKNYFHNAVRAVDPFHVTQWLNDTLDSVRNKVAKEAKIEYEKLNKKFKELADDADELIAFCEKEIENLSSKEILPEDNIRELQDAINELKQLKSDNNGAEIDLDKFNALFQKVSLLFEILKEKYKMIKGAKYALGKNPENLTQNQSDKLKIIESECPLLYTVYQYKERLRAILHMHDPCGAKEELLKWIEDTQKSEIPECIQIGKKVERHLEGILNSIKFSANSSKSEACNTSIRGLIYMGRGFRNLDNLISLVYLKCSNLVIPLFNRIQMTSEQLLNNRQHVNDLRHQRIESRKSLLAV